MYNVHLKNTSARTNNRAWLPFVASIFIIALALSAASSLWNNLWYTSKPTAQAAAASLPLINVPYFPNSVPFNQTAIFWFGTISSSTTYTDVRIGYSNSEVYVDLRIVDRYLWYDTNKTAPNLNNGDNASLYLSTSNATNTQLDTHSYQFQAAVNGFKQYPNYQKAYTGQGTALSLIHI